MNTTVTVSVSVPLLEGEDIQKRGFATVLSAICEGLHGPWIVESDHSHGRIAIRPKEVSEPCRYEP